MTASDPVEVADYEAQARESLARGREYLLAGDLHQASEKGWGAAAHMAKAVASAQRWQYGTHADFSAELNLALSATGDERLRGIANDLHRSDLLHMGQGFFMGQSGARGRRLPLREVLRPARFAKVQLVEEVQGTAFWCRVSR